MAKRKKAKKILLTASECAVCGCHDCTTTPRDINGQPVMLCDDCQSKIQPVRGAVSP